MSATLELWAAVPVKKTVNAKQRLAGLLAPERRSGLALAMLEDVLGALTAVSSLAGIVVVTVDPAASRLAMRFGARIVTENAQDGHTGAVAGAARLLAREGRAGMMTVPGDVPLITPEDVESLLAAHECAPSVTIVPAHDLRGSNAVLCSPPDAMPLRFGEDSFLPHLQAAERRGIRPRIVRLPRIALDIDRPEDLAAFLRLPSHTRTRAFLRDAGLGHDETRSLPRERLAK